MVVPKWSIQCTEVVCTEMVMYRSGPNPYTRRVIYNRSISSRKRLSLNTVSRHYCHIVLSCCGFTVHRFRTFGFCTVMRLSDRPHPVRQESSAIAKMTARCVPYALEMFGTLQLHQRLLFPNVFMGFSSDRPYECAYKI